MADPETPAPEGEEVAMFGGISRAIGETVSRVAPDIGQVVEGAGIIEAQRQLGETLRNSELLNGLEDVIHDVQERMIENLEGAPSDEEVIEAEPPQELQAYAAGGGEVAAADADGTDDVYDDTAEA